jgi:hypothetical protein
MKKIALTVSFLISLFVLAACSSTSKQQAAQVAEQSNAQRMLVISSAEPADVLPAFVTFSWNEQYSAVLSAADSAQKSSVNDFIRNEVMTYLQKKGYQYQADASKADVVIGFLLALQDSVADNGLQERFGLLPSRKKNMVRRGYKEGTFLLTVLDAELKKVYWRSALLGGSALKKEITEQNRDYMQVILHSMLGGFPKAGR